MSCKRNIFLIGPMGSGKSAVGRRLAHMLDLDFHDSDDEIETRTGVDIPYIFEKEGEPGFRRREARVIEDLTALAGIVMATGGGAAQDPVNRQRIVSRGTVIYLHASVDQQLRRTRRGRERPLLSNGNPRRVLEVLMKTRDPQYREIADFVVHTDGRDVGDVAREICRTLRREDDTRGLHGKT